ncbi:MAG: hypothetical protein WC781_03115 [Candidatus Pacearchaeota archaeon]|jgi:hypothetical protein
MNFKLTRLKLVLCLILFICFDILFSLIFRCVPYNIKLPTDTCTPIYQMIFDKLVLVFSLIVGIFVYLIWSLIQKKKN